MTVRWQGLHLRQIPLVVRAVDEAIRNDGEVPHRVLQGLRCFLDCEGPLRDARLAILSPGPDADFTDLAGRFLLEAC